MLGNFLHHPVSHFHVHHLVRLLIIVLLAMLAYLLFSDTAAGLIA
ncbi:MAG: hypothetical protein PVJ74_07640 [Gammaproteobacteria bacterium]|jgi:hypothetical protein